jgi:hypothetical protein
LVWTAINAKKWLFERTALLENNYYNKHIVIEISSCVQKIVLKACKLSAKDDIDADDW